MKPQSCERQAKESIWEQSAADEPFDGQGSPQNGSEIILLNEKIESGSTARRPCPWLL